VGGDLRSESRRCNGGSRDEMGAAAIGRALWKNGSGGKIRLWGSCCGWRRQKAWGRGEAKGGEGVVVEGRGARGAMQMEIAL
jgi:hypothetical protein